MADLLHRKLESTSITAMLREVMIGTLSVTLINL